MRTTHRTVTAFVLPTPITLGQRASRSSMVTCANQLTKQLALVRARLGPSHRLGCLPDTTRRLASGPIQCETRCCPGRRPPCWRMEPVRFEFQFSAPPAFRRPSPGTTRSHSRRPPPCRRSQGSPRHRSGSRKRSGSVRLARVAPRPGQGGLEGYRQRHPDRAVELAGGQAPGRWSGRWARTAGRSTGCSSASAHRRSCCFTGS